MSGPAPHRSAGFTLIEMIVVLAVLGLALGLVLERGPPHSRALDVRAAAGEIAGALRLARSQAVAADRPVRVVFDPAQHRLAIDGSAIQELPPIAMSVIPAFPAAAPGAILFAPDGSSSGGRIDISAGALTLRIGVSWLTGRVSVADAD